MAGWVGRRQFIPVANELIDWKLVVIVSTIAAAHAQCNGRSNIHATWLADTCVVITDAAVLCT